jgi:RHS repeat-associated protein
MVISDTNDIYLHGLRLISRQLVQSGASQYYHADGTRQKGLIEGYNHDAFGNELVAYRGSYTNDFRFAGEMVDGELEESTSETGLYYLRARYYDPEIGRFITKDPLPGRLTQPQSFNGYVYAANRPTVFTDPSGMIWPFDDLSWLSPVASVYNTVGSWLDGYRRQQYPAITAAEDAYQSWIEAHPEASVLEQLRASVLINFDSSNEQLMRERMEIATACATGSC